jgi:hypothetical protein
MRMCVCLINGMWLRHTARLVEAKGCDRDDNSPSLDTILADESVVHPYILFHKTYLNIILPSKPTSPT